MLSFAAVTTRGLQRPCNEDAVAAMGALLTGEATQPVTGRFDGAALFAVADGVGGCGHGARASRELMSCLIAQAPPAANPDACADAVCRAALGLHAVTLHAPETAGMATTIAGLALSGRSACWFNVGDSRVYRMRAGKLEQLSVDDTAEPKGGGPTPRRSHALTRSIGGSRMICPVVPHTGQVVLDDGDRLLLCSDGAWGSLSDASAATILAEQPEAPAAALMLLAHALAAGGPDNISIALIQ